MNNETKALEQSNVWPLMPEPRKNLALGFTFHQMADRDKQMARECWRVIVNEQQLGNPVARDGLTIAKGLLEERFGPFDE